VESELNNGDHTRQAQWTQSIAVGSKSFIEMIKDKLGVRAKGRKIVDSKEEFQLREDTSPYNVDLDPKKGNIGHKNTYKWEDI